MNASVADKLSEARAWLDELGQSTLSLAAENADVFEEPELRERLDRFTRCFDEAQRRLANPTLSIATIGTTSSGKSTIVNALVGRRIAPIEAGEMSAGVLTLRNSRDRCLTVEAPEGSEWEAGRWPGISDVDAYNRIRDGVMRRYHEARRSGSCAAPQVLSEGPILPAVDASLLGLPPELGVEFVDLPGLKSTQDRANLEVIQARVHKSFSLVALDYMQTDEGHRKKLLEELSRVVRFLQGRPDSMIFVLNRVDQRGNDDEPIEARISILKAEIKEVLGLRDLPDVLPFEARLLYRAQCAWGVAGTACSVFDDGRKLAHLKALFDESAAFVKRLGFEDRGLRAWLRDLSDTVDDGIVPSDDDLRRLLEFVRRWSGGEELWRRLRSRIEDSFAELVILPALIDLLDAYGDLQGLLKTLSGIRKIESRERLELDRALLEERRLRLHSDVERVGESFRQKLTGSIDALKSGSQVRRNNLTKELGSGFASLFNAVDDVTGDLQLSLIAPVRDALKTDRGVYDLEETVGKVLEPAKARDLARAYDVFSRNCRLLSRGQGAFVLRVREDDASGLKHSLDSERNARRLYQAVRECLTARAEFTLQGHAELILGALEGLLEQQAEAIRQVCLADLPELSLDVALGSACRAGGTAGAISLPAQFFELPEAVQMHRDERIEVVGKRREVEHYEDGCCFKEKKARIVVTEIKGAVAYKELVLPDEDEMARQWSEGVRRGEESLWDKLSDWMCGVLKDSSASFSAAISSVLLLAERALKQQESLAVGGYKSTVRRWNEIDRKIERLDSVLDGLTRVARSERE